MNTNKHTKLQNRTNNTLEFARSWPGELRRTTALVGTALTAVLLAAQTAPAQRWEYLQPVGKVFVIALENHNLTQPNPTASPQQILGNPAAPFINSLITPGHPNAAQVSYARAYYNTGVGVHPSEANYVWAEAGTDFGVHSDSDPNPANGNTYYDNSPHLVSHLTANGTTLAFWHRNDSPHLTSQLDAAGISWKNYQEDVELSVSPTNSASGNNGPVNPYNGSTQYSYAAKHNPMAFFSDSVVRNAYPLAQLFFDLEEDAVGRYNWITPDQYNQAHSSLNGGFAYQGIRYTGDQSAIAAADNFLSKVIPQIMASPAYQNNGVIILWWDETEGGDTTSYTLPEIVISPLAKGNAYASTVPMNHSSDLKTMEEIFHLPAVNNPIPAVETNSDGGYNNVATVNDLSDLFLSGAIPGSPRLSVTRHGLVGDRYTQRVSQMVHITNDGMFPVRAPLFVVLDNLSTNATLLNSAGTTAILAPLGSPYVTVEIGGDDTGLRPHESKTVVLEFLDPSGAAINYDTRVLNVTPAP
jgi:hypothetical protein